MTDFILAPFTIICDTREQHPFQFQGLRSDALKRNQPIAVQIKKQALQSGDYSIEGYEQSVSVERKSLPDLFGTVLANRDRFERELERLNAMKFAAVVIEAPWEQILRGSPRAEDEEHARKQAKTVYRSILAWQQRYPLVHWMPMPTRNLAERTTFRILERFWHEERNQRNGN